MVNSAHIGISGKITVSLGTYIYTSHPLLVSNSTTWLMATKIDNSFILMSSCRKHFCCQSLPSKDIQFKLLQASVKVWKAGPLKVTYMYIDEVRVVLGN